MDADFWDAIRYALGAGHGQDGKSVCGCPNCSWNFKEIAALSAQDEVKLVDLKGRLTAIQKRHEEDMSKINNEWMKLLADWKDKYQLHGYKEVGLKGNMLMGVPR